MRIKSLLVVLLSVFTFSAFAQDGGITGRVVSRLGRTPIEGVKITTSPLAGSEMTSSDGKFTIEGIDSKRYMVELSAPGYETLSIVVNVDGGIKDVYTVVMVPEIENVTVDDSFFAEMDTDISSDGSSAPVSLSASKDVFSSIASYKFSEMRFSQRGYGSQYADVMLNGINMNDALTGYSPWSLWGGLNEATRNQETTIGLEGSDKGLGGLNGSTNILARASHIRRGWSTSVVNANNMYRFRAMVTYASGMQDNGWAYAFSLSTRQGGNAYVDGIYYNTLGYFASIEKKINKHLFSLTFLGSPTERGAQQASTQEVYDLTGNNFYNANVGMQDGEMRNTRVREFHEPIAMFNYNYKKSDRTEFDFAASYRFGQNGYSALTWCAGSDPRADYYRYLPSYDRAPDPAGLTEMWENDYNNISRINLDELYQINYNGEQNPAYGNGVRSNYMIEERHTDQRDLNFAGQMSHKFIGGSTLNIGATVRQNRTEYYSAVKDLMGGDYWLDIDKFAERDFGSNELSYQNNVEYFNKYGQAPAAKEGDKYGYDYYAYVRKATLWGTYKHIFGFAPNLSASLSGEIGSSTMWREGLWLKGLFPYDSYGMSAKVRDFTYKAKLNATYNINRMFSVTANAAYMNNPATFQSAFISPRTRNAITPGLDTEKIMAFDAAFNARVGDAKLRLAGYYTTIEDQTKVISFYNDMQSSFDNFAMSGVDKRYMGIEAAVSVPIAAGFTVNSAVSLGEYIYNSNPYYIEMADNSATELSSGTVYWDGFRVEGTPQTAINLGLGYRSPDYLFLSLDLNYYDNNYLSMNPLYRTDAVTMGMNEEQMIDMRYQERFKGAYTLNASVGKSWYINREYNLGVSFELRNILNNQDIRTGGYEQMRLSENTDLGIYERFDSKYFYMLGRTYYLNVYLRF